MKNKILYALLLLVWGLKAQEVQFETDTKEIKIGEQIKYKISVEAPDGEAVLFPDGQTFSPLEMVRTTPIDTLSKGEKIRLEKEYFLTQFDSGSYTIPRQRISINSKDFFTDSLQIEVRSVAVDTLKQPLYDIKPIFEVTNNSKSNNWRLIVGVFLALIIVCSLLYFFVFRKKKLSPEEQRKKLPPFERAIQDLKNLQNSRYLIESKQKEYYSELTDIIREYFEDEVHILAKESTTDELLTKIYLLQKDGKLNLSEDTIHNLKRVLKTADLVKFAKNKPSDNTAEYDRETIEDVVVKTKKAIPQFTDESGITFEEQMKLLKRKSRKKAVRVAIIVSALYFTTIGLVLFFGLNSLKTLIGGQTTLQIDEKDWVTSDYGFPITQLTTPQALKRKQIGGNQALDGITDKQYIFETGNQYGDFYVMTNIITFKKQPDGTDQPLTLDPNRISETFLLELEKTGASNITTLQEEYTSAEGAKGIKTFGKMDFKNPITSQISDFRYELYNFTENGALQQLFVLYIDRPDIEIIAQKVVNSIKFKTE